MLPAMTSTPERGVEASHNLASRLSPIRLPPDHVTLPNQAVGNGSETDSNDEDPEKALSSFLLKFHNDNDMEITGLTSKITHIILKCTCLFLCQEKIS